MKIYASIFTLVFLIKNIKAQEHRIQLSYHYLNAIPIDNAIQTYNFSRPFLSEKQPTLTNGLNSSFSYFPSTMKTVKLGINLGYSNFRSNAENENFNNRLNFHFLNLGYILNYSNPEKFNRFYAELILSAFSTFLFRKINYERYIFDDKLAKSIGIGGAIELKLAYKFTLKNYSVFSPFISSSISPFYYSPNNEAIINQTKGMISSEKKHLTSFQIGISYHFLRK